MSTVPVPPPTSRVEARFYVASSTEHGQPSAKGCTGQVTLNAVSRGDQNRQWASATPSGGLNMMIQNPAAFEEIRSWQRQGWDVQVVLAPVTPHQVSDGHPFRQAIDPGWVTNYRGEAETPYYAALGKCGDCGGMQADHPLDPKS